MGSRCYWCGDKFGRCYDHAGMECPPECGFGRHDCSERDYWLDVEDSEIE